MLQDYKYFTTTICPKQFALQEQRVFNICKSFQSR